jgi:hypothetical protein
MTQILPPLRRDIYDSDCRRTVQLAIVIAHVGNARITILSRLNIAAAYVKLAYTESVKPLVSGHLVVLTPHCPSPSAGSDEAAMYRAAEIGSIMIHIINTKAYSTELRAENRVQVCQLVVEANEYQCCERWPVSHRRLVVNHSMRQAIPTI